MRCLMNIPYVDLAQQQAAIKEKLLEAVGRVLDHGKFVLGEEVGEFERRFAELCGVPYAVSLNSGTDALILALRTLGIGPGDEVITVANSFVSSTSCIVYVGATPVFVDVREDYLMDPDLIEGAVTSRTKAILPVHWTGRPCDMAAIRAIAKKYKLVVVEDCAQAVAAEYHGQRVGSLGEAGCFSLHPLKTLNACGDGGVLTTSSKKMYEEILALRDNGFYRRHECVYWSNNSRLDTIHAAMLLVKLDYLESWTESRRANAHFYQKYLKSLPQVQLPPEEKDLRAVYHTFIIQADGRDELQAFLSDKGIGTKVHYAVPIHLQPVARDLKYTKGSLPATEAQADRVLSLPVSQSMQPEMLEYVVNMIKEFYGSTRSVLRQVVRQAHHTSNQDSACSPRIHAVNHKDESSKK